MCSAGPRAPFCVFPYVCCPPTELNSLRCDVIKQLDWLCERGSARVREAERVYVGQRQRPAAGGEGAGVGSDI